MSLKAELEIWAAALQAYDDQDLETSLELFSKISDTSKILFNIGLIYATLGEHEAAVDHFTAATDLDQYLAVAYFQSGVSNFLLARYDAAHTDFSSALLYLRGNTFINYDQLGLPFKLFSAEVLFNRGLAHIYNGNIQAGFADLQDARREKATPEHAVIDAAIDDRGEGYTVFSIPLGMLYRPSQKKLENAKPRDFLGKARLVTADSANDLFPEFAAGVSRIISTSTVRVDDAQASLARAATIAAPSLSALRPRTTTTTTTTNNTPDALQRAKTLPAPPLSRSASSASSSGPPKPMRALTIRKPAASSSSMQPQAAAAPTSRLTELYDGYFDGYAADDAPRARARNSTEQQYRSQLSAPPSSYSSFGNGTGARRKPSLRRALSRSRSSRGNTSFYSRYLDDDDDEEEEGYVSGEYFDDGFAAGAAAGAPLAKIRVKLHFRDDVRGMALAAATPFAVFVDTVARKFAAGALGMKFEDEEGARVSLRDEMDYEMAIETARHNARGREEGRLEIWCVDE